MTLPTIKRECGICAACCTAIGVHELNKPAGKPCQFAHEGCDIYDQRPGSCRKFVCHWLTLPTDVNDHVNRPDNLGIVLFRQTTKFGDTYCAFATTPLSFQMPRAHKYLTKFAEKHLVILMTNPRRVIGPPNQLARAKKLIEQVTKGRPGYEV